MEPKRDANGGPSWSQRIVRFPLVWMIIGIALTLVVPLTAEHTLGKNWNATTSILVKVFIAVAGYWVVMRFLARRSIPELSGGMALRETLVGLGVGAVMIGTSLLILVAGGWYSFSRVSGAGWGVALPLLGGIAAPVIEELAFRGVMLQAAEEMGGSKIALLVTSAFFGLAHLFNKDATVWTAIAIAVQAGLVLGAAFLWRRSLWFVIGIHYAWNTTINLLGVVDSGGLFTVTTSGPTILTGGAFGIESSIVPVIIGTILAAAMLRPARLRLRGRAA